MEALTHPVLRDIRAQMGSGGENWRRAPLEDHVDVFRAYVRTDGRHETPRRLEALEAIVLASRPEGPFLMNDRATSFSDIEAWLARADGSLK